MKRKQHRQNHGLSRSRFYRIFWNMKTRCENKKDIGYKNYGGRGVKCTWKCFDDFRKEMFDSYIESVKKRGEVNTTIDRIDSSGDYCKKNCRWATYGEQNNNRRDTRKIEVNGRTLSIAEWARVSKINQNTLYNRIDTMGWDPVVAVTTKSRKYEPRS